MLAPLLAHRRPAQGQSHSDTETNVSAVDLRCQQPSAPSKSYLQLNSSDFVRTLRRTRARSRHVLREVTAVRHKQGKCLESPREIGCSRTGQRNLHHAPDRRALKAVAQRGRCARMPGQVAKCRGE